MADHPGDRLTRLRSEYEQAEREISRGAAVHSRLETRADRATRGVDDPGRESAVAAFDRWLTGADDPGVPGDWAWRTTDDDRPAALSYLTEPLLAGNSVFDTSLEPAVAEVQTLAGDIKRYVEGESVDPGSLVDDFRTLVESGDGKTVASLVALFEQVVRAARRHRDDRREAINGTDVDPGGTATPQTNPNADGETSPGADGALGDFFAEVSDELQELGDDPIALLPVRLETRFVMPNEATAETFENGEFTVRDVDTSDVGTGTRPVGEITGQTGTVDAGSSDDDPETASDGGSVTGQGTAAGTLRDWNRTEPEDQELRVRVYPDQVHVDSHEPELGATEERWGRNFWAQMWFACHRTETVDEKTVVDYDESKLPEDLQGVVERLHDGWHDRFSADDAARHAEIKERAWGQLVERFGQERAAWVVHAMAPERGTAMLTGWAGGDPPWQQSEGAPALSLPAPEARPESWSRQPKARLLPDRWLAVGTWRRADEPDAELETVRVTGEPIQHPLPVGPNPETVAGDDLEEREGTAPEGMEWMVDWEAARDVGMALTITPEDVNGEDLGELVFEELLVVGVKASLTGTESTNAIESLLGSHHYTEGLELLRRGTPTNNHDLDSGYVKNPRPEETVDVECGGPLTSFGDFSDGDLLARALGISDPGEPHVFAHVDGAGERNQAAARHMNSVLWPGTIGYYWRNILVDNDWAGEPGLWNDSGSSPSPQNPFETLGNELKSMDAWRRHFVRYVRAGGPFPPVRVGRQPYGILPVERIWSEDDGHDYATVPGADTIEQGTADNTVSTVHGDVDLSQASTDVTEGVDLSQESTDVTEGVDLSQESTDVTEGVDATGTVDPTEDSDTETGGTDTGAATGGTDDMVQLDAEQAGQVSQSGYAVSVPESAGQTDADLYGSSFDPAVPTTSSTSNTPDGGTAATYLRNRAFRVDDQVPGELADWLGKFTPAWEQSIENVDRVDSGANDSTLVERILGREASADDYLRETIMDIEDYRRSVPPTKTGLPAQAIAHHKQNVVRMLQEHDMGSLDPRLANLVSSAGPGVIASPDPPDRPIAAVASDRAPRYLEYLYEEDVDFLREMGYEVPLRTFEFDREWLKDNRGYTDAIDDWLDTKLAVHTILQAPDSDGVELVAMLLQTHGQDLSEVEEDVLDILAETQGDSLQHTLFKQLTRFSTLQAYLAARIRLGVKWDEQGIGISVAALLDSDSASGTPVPEPVFHDENTKTAWEALGDEPPAYDDYDSYAELLRKTCAPQFDEPAVDPRMREFFESVAALESEDAGDLRRLLTETLDLASHRLDAWWTSLATRRLFEHRESQEVDLYDGAEYAFVGDHFRRGEGTETPADPSADGTQVDYGQVGAGRVSDAEMADLTDTGPLVEGQTEYGFVENAQSRAVATEGMSIAGDAQTTTEDESEGDGESAGPVTYVGAYGFVENLYSDRLDDDIPGLDSASGGQDAEYVHAPSPQHATTAAILRSGRKNHDGNEKLEELLDIDLSPGRVRAARHVLEGIRQGQLLGELLGYRFERRLRERTKAYNDDHEGSINLVKYKFPLREKYPAVEGQLDHDQGESDSDPESSDNGEDASGNGNGDDDSGNGDDESAGIGSESAKSDVLDGYRLLTNWQETDDDSAFLASIDYEVAGDDEDAPTDLDEALSGGARAEFLAIFRELDAIVDSVTDLLLAESVHQLGKGNFDRAGGTVDDLVKGKQVADPEVAETPRDDVGVTHRLGVVLGDPDNAETPTPWDERSPVVEPDGLPRVGADSGLRSHTVDADLHLQARADAERNLDAWLGNLLPRPERVSCGASIRWSDERAVHTGTVSLPTDAGTVSVTDLDFAPDLVVLSVPHAVGGREVAGEAGPYGWTHGIALRNPDGSVDQVSTSVGLDPDGSEGSGRVSDDGLHLQYHDPDAARDDHGELVGSVAFAEDGFDLDVTTVDTPEGATEGAMVTYRAYALGNAATAEVGRFETPAGTDDDSVELDVTADHALLVGNTAATTAQDTRTTGDALGLSHGVVSDQDGTITQHAVASSVDPASGDSYGGVHDDEVLHLVYGSGGSVTGTTAASVTSLGESIDLSYSATHAGEADDASRVVAYVAIETPERVPTPAVGVIDGTRSEGDRTTVTTGFEPGYVEFVTAPAVSSTGSDGPTATGGFAHGAATSVGRQVTTSHAVRVDSDGDLVHAGSGREGQVLSMPSLSADGSVGGDDTVRVASTSADGFTVSVGSAAAGDQVLCYRAWPAEPTEVTHVVDGGVSLADLDLAPLDALALSQTNQQAGASQLEQRMHYTLLRDPPDSEPPVPDEATVELQFGEAAPDAPADEVSVGAFLETVRELRQLVGDGRPMDASDLGHPSEVTDEGYTDASADELKERADDAQERLAAAGTLVENRVERLDADDDETRITEDVARLRERLTEFHRAVPLDGLATVASQVGDALSADEDALLDELDELAKHLPAGPTDRANVDEPVVVDPRADQTIDLEVDATDTDVAIELWSTSGVEWFERTDTAHTDPDGSLSVELDFDDVTPGAGFVVYVWNGTDLLTAEPGRVLPAADALTVRPAPGQLIEGQMEMSTAEIADAVGDDIAGDDVGDSGDTDPAGGGDDTVTLDVSLTPVDDSSPAATEQVEPRSDGSFTASLDCSSLDPWTAVDVAATRDGDTVFSTTGYVEGAPAMAVGNSDVLGGLLWLADRTDAFDPHGSDGPVPDLHRTVTEEIDWETVREECELMADLHDRTGDEDPMPAESDVGAVASIVDVSETSLSGGDFDDGGGALEHLDLTALDAAVASVGRALSGLAVDEMFDVTGRPDRADGLQFWTNRAAVTNEGVLTRFEGFRTHPSGVFDDDLPDVGFAPAVESVFTDVADDAYPRGRDDATRFLQYLRPFLRAMPRLVEDGTMQGVLDDPAALARALHAIAFHPDEVPTGTTRSTVLADLRRLTTTQVLDGALYTPVVATSAMTARATGMERVLGTAGIEAPYYNYDDSLLEVGEDDSTGDGQGGSDASDGEDGGDDTGSEDDPLLDVGHVRAADFTTKVTRRPISFVEGPDDTPAGTPLTDFRYLLEQFRTEVLPTYLNGLDRGTLPPDEATSRSDYATDITNRATTLETTVSTEAANLAAGLDVGAFDVSFRRGVLETLRRGMVRCSYFGVYGSTPQSVRGGTEDDVEILLGQAGGVLATVTDRFERASPATAPGDPTPAQRVDHQRRRLEAIFGEEFPVLPTFRPVNGPELTATFDRSEQLQGGDPLAAETWLQRVARVRDNPARFRRGLTYAESLSGRRHRHLEVGQLPHRETELWAGLDSEDPDPGRLSLVAQFGTDFDGSFDGQPIAGLFVDEHVENVPGDTETTGVALNYDDPDVTAPQSILLALPPEDGGWTRDRLEDVVTDTRRLMKLRMVDLEDMLEFGPLLPMLSFPNNDAEAPDAPSMDITALKRFNNRAPSPAEIRDATEEDR